MSTDISDRRELISGWGRTAPTAATVVRPQSCDEVVRALARAPQRGLIGRGLGRSYGDAAQSSGGQVLDTSGLQDIELDATTGLVRCGAGVSFDALMRYLVPRGWFVPVTPGTRFVTAGGAVAADIHGKNHHVDGSFGHWLRAVDMVTPRDGLVHVAADMTDPLFAATVGGMGLTGIIVSVTFQAVPVTTNRITVRTERVPDLDTALDLMGTADEFRYTVAWIDLLAEGSSLGRGVLTRGVHSAVEELPVADQHEPLTFAPSARLTVRDVIPPKVLNPLSIRAFNEVYYRAAPRRPAVSVEHLTRFFHPLDGVNNWNRLYGRTGLMQYQFVVPLSATGVLRTVVQRLAERRLSSFLAVLKRLGAGSGGYLSFPMEGWTLSLDLPVDSRRIGSTFSELDELVLAAGGRIYLAKDAILRARQLTHMYPDLDRFRAARRIADPDRRLMSDLSRRLEL